VQHAVLEQYYCYYTLDDTSLIKAVVAVVVVTGTATALQLAEVQVAQVEQQAPHTSSSHPAQQRAALPGAL
jgi:hypothetical protein